MQTLAAIEYIVKERGMSSNSIGSEMQARVFFLKTNDSKRRL